MIKQSKYLPKQMNGPVVNAWAQAMSEELQDAENITSYLVNLSIATAQKTELENIGRLIGYPRPLVPDGFNEENLMLLSTLPQSIDRIAGLAALDSEIGGTLASTETAENNYMALDIYRRFLSRVALIKRYGLTLKCVDDICSIIGSDYTIKFDSNKDILVTFNEAIGYKNVYLLTQMFYRFATAPQVLITAGE